jgi:amino acid adenylation domain-containing protein
VPADHLRPDKPSFAGGQVAFEVPAQVSSALSDIARSESATTFMALLAAWQLFLHRYTLQDDILVGTPTGRRYRTETEHMIGLFINNLVLRADFSSNPSFRQLLHQTRHTTIDAFTHDELPFEDLVAELRPERTTGVSPLFQHLFIHRNATHSRWQIPGLALTPMPMHPGGSKFDLTLSILEDGPKLSGTLEYSCDLFERDTAERMVANFLTLLGSAVEQPDRPGWKLELLTDKERRAAREAWNQTACDYPKHLTTHQLFEQQAAERPESTAISGEERTLSYAELNRRANQLATELRRKGVGPDQLVAVCMERSPELIVSLLAVFKAGGAYVPLDPKFPIERLSYMVENSEAKICISQKGAFEKLSGLDAEVVIVDHDSPIFDSGDHHDLERVGDTGNLAYVIYTSGSTGKPKGVQITHQALVNFLCAMRTEPGIGPNDVLQSLTTVCFDIAALEIFLPLIVGAQVVIQPQRTSLDPLRLLDSVRQHGATIMQATPVTWRMLLDHGWRGDPKVKVLCGGEAMGLDLAEKLVATGCEVWNMYGPTETTIWSSVRNVRSKEDAASIGLPIANTEFLVCSPQLTLQPIGVPGELLIGGDGLARGYLKLDDKTKERFIPHPFEPNQRLYRTGDLVSRHANGDIHFIGRIDNQVKIRGYRIELGEIETRLSEHSAVKQNVVIVREETPGDKRLVAYLLLERPDAASAEELRKFLRSSLPEYMVPSAFVFLDEFPLTPNGKVDRKRLPAPRKPERSPTGISRVMTVDQTTAQLVDVFESVIKAPLTSLSDNFFDVGGHSMGALSAVREINLRFGLALPASFIFDFPTVEKLAAAIEGIMGGEDEASINVPALSAAETAQVNAILDLVRTAESAAKPTADGPPVMRESRVCKHILAPMYVGARRSVKPAIKRAILKLEGGSAFTVTLRKLFKKCHDIEIGDFTSCSFDADRLRRTTKIGKFCSIYRTALFQNADHPRNTLATHGMFYHPNFGFAAGYELDRVQIEVGNDVWIGDGAKILYPTRKIGDGAIIAAGAVVVEDVPPYAIVAGYPAQVVRHRFSKETIEKLLELRWWDEPLERLHRVRDAFIKPLEGDRVR